MRKSGALALIVILIWSTPAGAILQGLDLQTQLQYRVLEIKSRDGVTSSHGGLTSTYGLALRQPLTPWARLVSNITLNSLANTDEFGKQENTNLLFNLGSYERTYTLTMGYVQNQYRAARQLVDGPSTISTGVDTNYDLNFFMEEPSYPALNLQFRRRTSSIDNGFDSSNYYSQSYLARTYYEVLPFRFSVDQSKQIVTFSGSSQSESTVTHRRMAANFDQKIISGLNLSGEFSKNLSDTTLTNQTGTSLSGNSRSLRLTATPTSAIVITANQYARDSVQDYSRGRINSRDSGSSISMRSEVMPGLALNLTKSNHTQADPSRRTASGNLTASLNAILAPDVMANLVWTSVRQDSMPEASRSNSKTTTASLQMPAGMGLDMILDAGMSRVSGSSTSAFDSKFAGVSLRGSLSSDATAGVAYRWNQYATQGIGGNVRQRNNSVDLDLSWFPTGSIGVNARLNYYLNSGSSVSEFISPFVDMSWVPNSTSTLTARYNFSTSRQWDALEGRFSSFGDKGLSLRYSQQLGSDSSFNLLYDFQGNDIGDLEWQRSLRVFFSHKL